MFGEVLHDVEVDVAASQTWKLYGSLELAKIIQKGLSHMVEKIELLEGDGGVGTILQLTLIGGQCISLNFSFFILFYFAFY